MLHVVCLPSRVRSRCWFCSTWCYQFKSGFWVYISIFYKTEESKPSLSQIWWLKPSTKKIGSQVQFLRSSWPWFTVQMFQVNPEERSPLEGCSQRNSERFFSFSDTWEAAKDMKNIKLRLSQRYFYQVRIQPNDWHFSGQPKKILEFRKGDCKRNFRELPSEDFAAFRGSSHRFLACDLWGQEGTASSRCHWPMINSCLVQAIFVPLYTYSKNSEWGQISYASIPCQIQRYDMPINDCAKIRLSLAF